MAGHALRHAGSGIRDTMLSATRRYHLLAEDTVFQRADHLPDNASTTAFRHSLAAYGTIGSFDGYLRCRSFAYCRKLILVVQIPARPSRRGIQSSLTVRLRKSNPANRNAKYLHVHGPCETTMRYQCEDNAQQSACLRNALTQNRLSVASVVLHLSTNSIFEIIS